jgi:hypothetical protein
MRFQINSENIKKSEIEKYIDRFFNLLKIVFQISFNLNVCLIYSPSKKTKMT